jgi:uncharacterized protein YjbI with pentapeptide repeats
MVMGGGFYTLFVSVTPSGITGDTSIGCHLYLEIPDQSATATFTVGTNTIGDGSTTSGNWQILDLGRYTFDGGAPWTITGPLPFDINADLNIPCRLYANPFSTSYEGPLVQANQPGASPNQTFTLVSLKSGSPTAGTNVTTLTGGDGNLIGIVATPLTPVNVTGKLETPVLVDVSDTPPNVTGWVARLVLTVGNADPTQVANQQVVGSILTQAGPVYAAPGDGISVPHSFALDTPKTFTTATIWLQAGLKNAKGVFSWNNIVPGITPSFSISYGSTSGTTDATAIMTATIAASMAVVNNLFGVAAAGITNTLLGSGAVATINIQALAVTNPLLASLCVTAANLASSSVTATAIAALAVGTAAIQTVAITNALIANLAVSGAQIQSATITGANIASATIAGANIGTATIVQANMASASIGTAQIQSLAVTDALIANCSVSKLAAGTANFSGTATFSNGSNLLQISSSGITVQATSNDHIAVTSGTVTITSSGQATTIVGNVLTCGVVTCGSFTSAGLNLADYGGTLVQTRTSAVAGSYTPPSQVALYLEVEVLGTVYLMPLYNI